jgi:hypothetical protein
MTGNSGFWPAFFTGLTGSVSLYNRPPNYWTYVGGYTIAQTFAIVGSTMSYTSGVGHGGGQSTGWHSGPTNISGTSGAAEHGGISNASISGIGDASARHTVNSGRPPSPDTNPDNTS